MTLTINGKSWTFDMAGRTGAITIREVVRIHGDDCDVVILNGFQTADDIPLRDGDCIALIKKGAMPPPGMLDTMMRARHTPGVHDAVRASTVGIAGLGGLGSNVAAMLARVGVGRLVIADFDVVEPSNLNRQNYYVSHLGMMKSAATKELLAQINPYTKVEARAERVTAENAKEVFGECAVVCEAFDNPAQKAMLANAVLLRMPGVKLVAASGMAGFGSANRIQTRRAMKNFYLCGDSDSEAMPGNGLMAPRVMVCAAHQASMALRLLLGEVEP